MTVRRAALFVLFLAISPAFTLPAHAGQVVAITDGDTLTMLQDRQLLTVRLAKIDAPERRQPYGRRARQSLVALCLRKDATLAVQGRDRYGRTVAVVRCNGVEANREQVRRGLAWVYPQYNKDRTLPELEASSKAARRGLWRQRQPTAPWVWRATLKSVYIQP